MSTILIAVPEGLICRYLHVVVGIRGHVALDHEAPGADARTDLDAVIVDPSRSDCLRAAEESRRARPELPIICVSANERVPEADALRPLRHLVLPFRVEELESALRIALA